MSSSFLGNLACNWWWVLFGGLLGLLGSWLIGRLFKREHVPVERLVEKVVDRPVDRVVEVEKLVDNPLHLTRIKALEADVGLLAGLRSQLAQLQAAPPKVVEKIVEKIVDRPVDRVVERVVEKVVDRPVDRIVEKVVEKVVDRPVDRVVEKLVDNPVHLTRIRALEADVGLLAGLRSQIAQLQATPPRIVEKIVEKIVDRPVDRVVEKLVPDTRGIEEREARLRELQRRYDELDVSSRGYLQRISGYEVEIARLKAPPRINMAAAKAAGFKLKIEDDLEIIEGIGPKIAQLFYAAGVKTFYALSKMTAAQIQPILDGGGANFKLAVPDTWPQQAALAADNRWTDLAALQEALDAGKR